MDRRDYFYRQKVQEDELDEGFDGAENADRAMMEDFGLVGCSWGLAVSEHSPQDVSVDVAAGAAYDQDGQRMYVPSLQNVDLTNDYLGNPTAVTTPGNEKIVGVFLKFDRALTDPRIDGNSLTVYFQRDESYAFVVRQGAEASPPATPPSLQSDEILLADVTRTQGDITIANADIDTARREDAFKLVDGATAVASVGTPEAALQAVIDYFSGSTGAGAINFTGSSTWADGSGPLAATNVGDALDEIVSTLAGTSASAKVGHAQTATWENSNALGQGGSVASIDLAIEAVVTDLADKAAAGDCGADRIGAAQVTNTWENSGTIGAGSIMDQINQVVGDLAAKTSASVCGADRIGAFQTTAGWNDTTKLSTASVMDQINEIVSVLGASTGSVKLGSAGYAGVSITLSTGSILDQIQELADGLGGLAAANTWTNTQAFSNRCDFNSSPYVNNSTLYLTGTGRFDTSGTTQYNIYGDLTWAPIASATLDIEQRPGTGSFTGNAFNIRAQQGQDASGVQGNRGGPVQILAGPGGNGTSYGDNGHIHFGFATDANVNTYYRHLGSGEKNYATPGPTDILTVPMISTETWAVEVTMCAQDTGGAEKVQRRSAMIDRDGSLVTITGDTLDKDVGTGDAAMTLATVSSVGFKVQVAGSALSGNCGVFVRAYIVTT